MNINRLRASSLQYWAEKLFLKKLGFYRTWKMEGVKSDASTRYVNTSAK